MSPATRYALVFLFSCLAPQIAAFTQCYFPDGSIPVDYVWEPCVGTGHSSCCILSEGDVCQPNGLCYYGQGTWNNTFRGTCTDRSWNDPACPKDICVEGQEDTWAWASPCVKNNTFPSQPDSYACGIVVDTTKREGLCPIAAQSTYYDFFITKATTSQTSKPTRYTSPPPLDPSKYSVYTETYTATIRAKVQTTTFATTWESTITSTIGATSAASLTNSGDIAETTPSSILPNSATESKSSSGITLSPGILAVAIGAPIIGLGIVFWLIFYFRAKRQIKAKAGAERLDSSNSGPENGPVGAAQLRPYEVPATEARSRPGTAVTYDNNNVNAGAAGYYAGDKYPFTASSDAVYEKETAGAQVYEMGAISPRIHEDRGGYLSPSASVSVMGSPRPQEANVAAIARNASTASTQIVSPMSPRSPAPTYTSTYVPPQTPGAVELDSGGGDWQRHPPALPQRPLGSNRNGVGNA